MKIIYSSMLPLLAAVCVWTSGCGSLESAVESSTTTATTATETTETTVAETTTTSATETTTTSATETTTASATEIVTEIATEIAATPTTEATDDAAGIGYTVNLALQTDAVPIHKAQGKCRLLVGLLLLVDPYFAVFMGVAVCGPSQQLVTRHTDKGTGNESAVCLTFRQSVTVCIPLELQVELFNAVCLMADGQPHHVAVIRH